MSAQQASSATLLCRPVSHRHENEPLALLSVEASSTSNGEPVVSGLWGNLCTSVVLHRDSRPPGLQTQCYFATDCTPASRYNLSSRTSNKCRAELVDEIG